MVCDCKLSQFLFSNNKRQMQHKTLVQPNTPQPKNNNPTHNAQNST